LRKKRGGRNPLPRSLLRVRVLQGSTEGSLGPPSTKVKRERVEPEDLFQKAKRRRGNRQSSGGGEKQEKGPVYVWGYETGSPEPLDGGKSTALQPLGKKQTRPKQGQGQTLDNNG